MDLFCYLRVLLWFNFISILVHLDHLLLHHDAVHNRRLGLVSTCLRLAAEKASFHRVAKAIYSNATTAKAKKIRGNRSHSMRTVLYIMEDYFQLNRRKCPLPRKSKEDWESDQLLLPSVYRMRGIERAKRRSIRGETFDISTHS